jgi:hypothetical protein
MKPDIEPTPAKAVPDTRYYQRKLLSNIAHRMILITTVSFAFSACFRFKERAHHYVCPP